MGKYDDIINLPHPEPKNHPRMPMLNRAAQFAPFAALTGYNAAINETARQTDSMITLGDEDNERLNSQIAHLLEKEHEHPEVTIVYFQPDERKAGGSFQTCTGKVKRIDQIDHTIIMTDGQTIKLQHLVDLKL